MDQVKIGKFIKERRNLKGLTQQDLADKLGVTDKSIGNWENGRNMPDLSLFKPLCDELDITINDLMSGEIVDKNNYQEKFEENVIDTIKDEKRHKEKQNGIYFILIGLTGMLWSFLFIDTRLEFITLIYDVALCIFYYGLGKYFNLNKSIPKCIIAIIIVMLGTIFVDYLNVKYNHKPPIYVVSVKKIDDIGYIYEYDGLFYKFKQSEPYNQNSEWVFEYK